MSRIARTLLFAVTALFPLALPSSLPARTFTYADGRTVEAEFVRLTGDRVTLTVAGRPATLPLGRFAGRPAVHPRDGGRNRSLHPHFSDAVRILG